MMDLTNENNAINLHQVLFLVLPLRVVCVVAVCSIIDVAVNVSVVKYLLSFVSLLESKESFCRFVVRCV